MPHSSASYLIENSIPVEGWGVDQKPDPDEPQKWFLWTFISKQMVSWVFSPSVPSTYSTWNSME